MKLSTKGRYGLMAMYRLAQNYGGGPISLKEIAAMEHLSEAYLEQLFSLLKKGELVKSIRGAGGGYLLARPPEDIPIGEVINALEGNLGLSCCSVKMRPECEKYNECATRDILEELQYRMEEVMDSMTLADM
ncbi:MAG: Rrf2 family transcriptional regulator [Tissierellia bacterium]|nr:Rrf2 family transcriptional regulator [Tissierellia bacterium]